MSGTKLFVGNLNFKISEQELGNAFEQFGRITEVKIIKNRETQQSRGFAFVSFDNADSANAAQQSLDGSDLLGRQIRVSYPNNE